MSDVYVYGVVPASETADLDERGVGSPPAEVRRIRHRDVAALVSDVEPGPLAAARDLRGHWRVLEAAGAAATVLPVRFGTVLPDDRAVVDEFLAPAHDRLRAALAELAGRVQLTVKATYEEEALMRSVVESSPAVARLRERVRGVPEAAAYYDRIQLGQLVAAEVERARRSDGARILARLEPLAVAARAEPPTAPEMAANAALLVERDHVDDVARTVAELGHELAGRITIRCIGPMPPYSFAAEEAAVA
jgi:hypothetical protein